MSERPPERLKAPDSTPDVDAALDIVRREVSAGAGGIPTLDDHQLAQLRAYLEALLLWRRRTALIATADPRLLAAHHVIDSLHVAPWLWPTVRLADIGSGAGFPGIPLAIALPAAHVSLVESRRKKASFLRAARRAAGLANVEVVEGRAETIDERFEAVVCRALGSVASLLGLAQGLLVPGGVAVSMKGPEALAEVVSHDAFAGPRVVPYELAHSRRRMLLIYTLR